MQHHTHATKTKNRRRAAKKASAKLPLIPLFAEFEIPLDLASVEAQPAPQLSLVDELADVTAQLDQVVTGAEQLGSRDPACAERGAHISMCECTGALRDPM